MARDVATVFGGSGFIGRHVVQRLAGSGYTVRVAGRDTALAARLRPMGRVGQVVPVYGAFGDDASLAECVAGARVVVNLVGILAERRRGDFDRIHHRAAGRIAELAAASGTERLVQVSAIGADPASPSRYGRSKAAGERAVTAAFPAAAIVRPSIVFGPGDDFFNRFASMARLLPVMPVVSGATRLAPVYVGDVADAIAELTAPGHPPGIWELGGPEVLTMRELLGWIVRQTGRSRPLVGVPAAVAKFQAAVLGLLPNPPLTSDQLAMLSRDNVPAAGAPGLAALGISPTPIEAVVPRYLERFRKPGTQVQVPV